MCSNWLPRRSICIRIARERLQSRESRQPASIARPEEFSRRASTAAPPVELANGIAELAKELGLQSGGRAPTTGDRADGGLIDQINLQQSFHVAIRTVDGKSVYNEGDNVTFEVASDVDCFITLVSKIPLAI